MAAAVAFLATACSDQLTGTNCTDIFMYGLNVTVVDSTTGAAPDSATLVARTTNAVDSVGPVKPIRLFPDSTSTLLIMAAGERPGTYDLTVTATGYRIWTRSGVEVTKSGCHVTTIRVTARLQRAP